MREIVFDTETTGLDALGGDRIVEIGCVELENRWPTGRSFQAYLDPERDMPQSAVAIHGLTAEFLRGKPRFADIVEEFLAFIGDSHLVAHNASFDMTFLDAELSRLGRPPLGRERMVDSLILAKRKFPGASNSLDALCNRFGIDSSNRVKHGALLDAELLAEVYIELIGSRQARLGLEMMPVGTARREIGAVRQRPVPLPSRLTEADRQAHMSFVSSLGEAAIWRKYSEDLADDAAVAAASTEPVRS